MNPICPYCNTQSELVMGNVVHPHRPDLNSIYFYLCEPCNAYVGTHKGSTTSLGTVANAELRAKRTQLHHLFDPLWQDGTMTRQEAYRWLADRMGIKKKQCHIGIFDIRACIEAIDILKENLS